MDRPNRDERYQEGFTPWDTGRPDPALVIAVDVAGAPFGAVWDRGCFHTQHTAESREQFARRVADHLDDGGIWLSVIGSTDGPERDTGPPRLSAVDVATAVEPHFEILELEESKMDPRLSGAPRSWVLLARKRG